MIDQNIYDKVYHRRSRRFQSNKERLKERLDIIKKYKPKKVLDVGCGLGFLVDCLRANGLDAVGVDGSEALKEFWKGDYYQVADANSLPFNDNTFDLVISTDFFEHIPEDEIKQVYSEMKRVVKPGGKILASIAMDRPLVNYQYIYHVTNKPKSWWEKRLPGIIYI